MRQKQEDKYYKAFKKLKNKITIQLILTLSRREEKFRVEIGEVLFQKQEEKWKLIAFLLRTM